MSVENTDPYWRPKHWENERGLNRDMPIHPGIFLSPCIEGSWWNPTNLKIVLGDMVIYFHYQHVMAFYTPTGGLRVAENWTKTSSLGRMLNGINPDKKIRIKREDLVAELAKYITEDFSF